MVSSSWSSIMATVKIKMIIQIRSQLRTISLLTIKALNRPILSIKMNSCFLTKNPVGHVVISRMWFVASAKTKENYANIYPSLHEDDNKKYDTTAVHVQDSGNEEQDSEYSDFSFMTIATDTSSVTTTICLNQHTSSIPKTWILLDNCSTIDMFFENIMLINIRPINRIYCIISNAGSLKPNLVGDVKGYWPVWYSKDVITNILSLLSLLKTWNAKNVELDFFHIQSTSLRSGEK